MLEQILQYIRSWISHSDQRLVIGISGHGAAGKTTFAHKLMDRLRPIVTNYVNTDPYIISSEVRKHAFIDYRYEGEQHRYKMTACHPAAHHVPSLERDIQMIRDGLDLYTMDTHYMKSSMISSDNQITIVEGMTAAFVKPELFDLTIYFYTDDETELVRRFGRDIVERGTDRNYLIQSHHERRVQYQVFMHPYREQFDLIVRVNRDGEYIEKNILESQIHK